MLHQKHLRKLSILADAAKYDASCASCGSRRRNPGNGTGNGAAYGICHSFTDDGRCVSLLKVLMSNHCEYNCAYCVNRAGNDIPRAAFSPSELAELVMEFYRRNYIEGLFLSSGVLHSPDITMQRMLSALRELRKKHRFYGYIHIKIIPGTSPELVHEAGLLADRLSVNIEIPSESNLTRLAPEKNYRAIYAPMRNITDGIQQNRDERSRFRHAPEFAPGGQSTQMIVGAGSEPDRTILLLASVLYQKPKLQRVYYSGFIPVNSGDPRLPALQKPPLVRENRLYQADWLMRLYGFQAEEILDPGKPDLELDIDPKLAWALRHPDLFPMDVNEADYWQILRIPGIGRVSARRILAARRHKRLTSEDLRRLGVRMKAAAWFLKPHAVRYGQPVATIQEAGPEYVRQQLSCKDKQRRQYQLSLFG